MSEPTLIRSEVVSYEQPGPAYDVYLDGRMVGRVARSKHTYRTNYKGKRYGYDRQHLCWSGNRFGTGASDPYGESFRCYSSRQKIVALVLRPTP